MNALGIGMGIRAFSIVAGIWFFGSLFCAFGGYVARADTRAIVKRQETATPDAEDSNIVTVQERDEMTRRLLSEYGNSRK